jgi:hypothetical protein
MAFQAVQSLLTRRNYVKSLDELFAFCATGLSPGRS